MPEPGTFSPELMACGLASLPAAFTWRQRRYRIVECLDHHKQSSPESSNPSAERYLRRQVFRVRLDTDEIATLYVLREARAAKRRWFMYSLASGEGPDRPARPSDSA